VPENQRVQELLASCQKINAQLELPALFELIAKEATKLLNADRASIFLLDTERNELWSLVAHGVKEIRFDARLGLAGAAVLSGKPIRLDDAREDPRFHTGIDAQTRYRTRSILVVPVRSPDGKVIGAFQALNKKGGVFSAEDQELLEALATQAGTTLLAAHRMDQLCAEREKLEAESAHLRKDLHGRSATQQIVGGSEKVQQIVRRIEQISDADVNVLITGESGTGKEMVARAIHYSSGRTQRPLVSLNCAALPESLVESELFGIEKGVATGVEARAGKFEAANGGTLFLDEIGDLTLPAQAKILRVLQEKVVEHVGGRRSIPVDVRVIAATNKDLEVEIKDGKFRSDLYYRLNVIHLRMPALREIPGDVPALANHFLRKYCREMKREPLRLSAEATRHLTAYHWPGNTRELENEMKRAVICARRATVTEQDLSESVNAGGGTVAPSKTGRSLKDVVVEVEKRMIRDALQSCSGNQQRAARLLGISRQGLIKKIKRYGVK
jgi:Nif-specific regulatory protein